MIAFVVDTGARIGIGAVGLACLVVPVLAYVGRVLADQEAWQAEAERDLEVGRG